mmetsp:Transcript_22525/g.32965  ORF Transcript_22525/g.32965 Transcript_22525/m.32965 type:complete len:224 (-) Transcript_22525:334-1005(-)|eukprot:CAMPEP_0197235622 /NCGR_PEP_ID=MMETSP1429-20130617/3001_1 /TAXON_ID=49237 /ORGANISM="Chaetoceros  sp., Strain UNC1202" /LENGTH=223 /DNA_ID=CAMNT_0042694251 /DNA_START=3 /DNA_END=674 /DNA_ORIENTATION=+
MTAIENGFYNLKNVKLVLEQSLIRTRGSLNMGDLMYCWFRGKKFDLTVHDVTPPDFGAISCVNCDIEVDFTAVKNEGDEESKEGSAVASSELQRTVSGGYRLSGSRPTENAQDSAQKIAPLPTINTTLPPEPPKDQKEHVLVIQMRGSGKTCRRRFDTRTATMKHLFEFAIVEGLATELGGFRLVTQFPRRLFEYATLDDGDIKALRELGFTGGREMFILENI